MGTPPAVEKAANRQWSIIGPDWRGLEGCIESVVAVPGLLAVGFGAPILIHFLAPDWEVPAIFGSLAASIVLFAASARRRHPGTLMLILIVTGISLLIACGTLAGVHGWVLADAIGAPLASLALLLYFMWLLGRPVRRLLALEPDEVAMLREPHLPPPVALPGEGTEIYPSRGKVARGLVIQLVALLASCGVIWLIVVQGTATPRDVSMLVAFALLALVMVWLVGMTAPLLVRRRPAVILLPEGFVDNVTLGASGMGYICWREVLGLLPSGKRADRRLHVLVADPEAVRSRVHGARRLYLWLLSLSWATPVAIPEWLLPMRAEALQEQMEQHMEAAERPAGHADTGDEAE